jgi:hypothetical protein
LAEVGGEMIKSAEEFVRLRVSDFPEEYSRAADDEAPLCVWLDVISRFPDMREWVACNKTVPMEVLELLARDDESCVRAVVAEKRKLSVSLFELLARDHDEMVRQRIAYNKKVPAYLLEELSLDSSPVVRSAALKSLTRTRP